MGPFKFLGVLLLVGTMLAGSAMAQTAATGTAILAGGCFWTMQTDMSKLPGQTKVIAGYTGGTQSNPTYETYHDGATPHVEAVQVSYDTSKISYAALLDYYFHHVDPTDGGGQFCDRGEAYRPVIFYSNKTEHRMAEAKKAEVSKVLKQTIMVDILPASQFWAAEDYHQDYAKKNSTSYHIYRAGCGKDARIGKLWGGM